MFELSLSKSPRTFHNVNFCAICGFANLTVKRTMPCCTKENGDVIEKGSCVLLYGEKSLPTYVRKLSLWRARFCAIARLSSGIDAISDDIV